MIKEISIEIFESFVKNSPYNSYTQTKEFALTNENDKTNILYLGYYENGNLVAASLLFVKAMQNMIKYAYAPKGFILDFQNRELIKNFTSKLKSYLMYRNIAFLRINPEVIYAKVDYKNQKKYINAQVKDLLNFMETLGYKKEESIPSSLYNPIVDLDTFLNDELLKEINSENEEYLHLLLAPIDYLNTFYKFIDSYSLKSTSYYNSLFKNFQHQNKIDLILIELNYNNYLNKYRKLYEKASIENENINYMFSRNIDNIDIYNMKMKSDKNLNLIKHTIDIFNNNIFMGKEKEIIGGALVIKHNGKAIVIEEGINKELEVKEAKYFLYYNLIMYYKEKGYKYLNLKNLSGNFDNDNPYKNDDELILKFTPSIYEYIGPLDLVINYAYYNTLKRNGKIKEEFDN